MAKVEGSESIETDADEQTSLRSRLDGCNRLLSMILDAPVRLGGWLELIGFDSIQRDLIRRNCLAALLEEFDRALQGMAGEWSDPRLAMILRRRFGLDGLRPETLRDLALRLSVSHERVRQLEVKAIRRLRSKRSRLLLTERIRSAAADLAAAPANGSTSEAFSHRVVAPEPRPGIAPAGVFISSDDERDILESAREILREVGGALSFGMLAHVLAGSEGPVVGALVGYHNLGQYGKYRHVGRVWVLGVLRRRCPEEPGICVANGRAWLEADSVC